MGVIARWDGRTPPLEMSHISGKPCSSAKGTYVPLVPVSRSELGLRREAMMLLESATSDNIESLDDCEQYQEPVLSRIACIDSSGLEEIGRSETSKLGTRLILVDHNAVEPGVVSALGLETHVRVDAGGSRAKEHSSLPPRSTASPDGSSSNTIGISPRPHTEAEEAAFT